MNPKGQQLFGIYTALSYVCVACCTSHTLPCLNTKQVAVKIISKDQLPLDGQIMAGTTVGTGQENAWTVDRQNTGSNFDNYDKISFSFNVNGIDAFQSASQSAFSWAMSCANDVVEGLVNVNRPTSVPEPTALLLMLFALGLIAKTRRKKAQYLSA